MAIVLAAVSLSLGLLQNLSSIIAPAFLTVNFLVAAYPIHTWLVKHKVAPALAAVVTGLTVFAALLVGIAALLWSLTEMVQALTQYSDQFVTLYDQAISWLAQFGLNQHQLVESLRSISPSSVIDVLGGLVSILSSAGGLIAVILVALVFMVMDLPSMAERLHLTHRLHPSFTQSISAFTVGIRRYWVVTTVFGLIVAAFDWVLLLILGVPLPLVWAVLSFITNYIPNVGFVIGLVPPALLALFDRGPVTALIVVIGYSVLNFLIQSIIQPKFAGDAVGVTPTVSFLSLLLWAWVFGALGALIALPATLAVKALLIDSDQRLRWVGVFLSNRPSAINTQS